MGRKFLPTRIAGLGEAVFAATLIALGIQGLVAGDFTAIWQPVARTVPAREVLAYLCAIISLASGMGLLWRRSAAAATRLLLAYLSIWLLAFKAPAIIRAPLTAVGYESCGETAVIVAAAWALYARYASDWDHQHLGFATGDRGLRISRGLYGLSMLAFGLSHFVYVKDTASLVPGWLPSHAAWAYFTGGAYLAAGLAVLTDKYARVAAALSAVQMGLFTLLVWVPVVAAGSRDPFVWSETILSWTLATAAWVTAVSIRPRARAARGRR
jgi:uncharacterized membrane protein